MERLSPEERAAAERAAAAPMLDWTERWAAVPSGSGDLPGLATMAGLLADAFSALPGRLDLVAPRPSEYVTPDGTVETVEHGRHLVLAVRPEAPVQLLLTGHMDTVYGPAHAFRSVATLPDGRINGPSVADMKGGLAILLAALKAVEASAVVTRVGYTVLINSDEEVGSPSSGPLIAELARGRAAALTYEPALPDGMLAGARPGSGNFAIVVTGRAAHAGRNPEDGRNAVVAAADLAVRLAKTAGARLSVNPARIDGGGPTNVVPDGAVLRVNMRPATPEDEARGRAHLDAAIAMVAAEHDVRVGLHGGFGRPPKPVDAGAERLFGLVAGAGRDLGLDLGWRPTGGVCDGNNIAAAGVPVVDTMGARGGAIHSSDEYLIPESLPERAALSVLTILRLAS